jgi:hypothetical protein
MPSNRARKGLYQIQRLCVFTHSGKEYDFDSNFEILHYKESIFENQCCFGHVSFLDVEEILVNFSIVGGERLLFEYKVAEDTKTITKNFIVYNIATESGASNRNNHTLYFASEELFHSKNTSISRSYKDKTAKFIVQDLFSEINKRNQTLNTHEVKGSHHIIIPNYQPLVGINFVSSITQHPSYKSGGFYFFENSNGYNFFCLEKMMDSKPIMKFYKNFQKVDTGVREKTGSLTDIRPISTNTDIISCMDSGMFANRHICYDPIAKAYKTINYKYKDAFKETKHLNKFALDFEDQNQFVSPEQYIEYFPSNSLRKKSSYFKQKADNISHSNDLEDVLPYARSVFPQLFAKNYEITLKGDDVLSMWEKDSKVFTVGEVIEMEQNTKSASEDKSNQPHTYFNGKYLVYWCDHTFTKNSYAVKAKVASDSNTADHNK